LLRHPQAFHPLDYQAVLLTVENSYFAIGMRFKFKRFGFICFETDSTWRMNDSFIWLSPSP
jgi:hypothetical protein